MCNKDEFIKIKNELTDAQETIRRLRGKAEFAMPEDMRGKFHNGQCSDACDMVDGPCACGAWHSVKEWLGKLLKYLNTAKKENQSFGNVLAVIHRDGGHYISTHGAEKASRDAIDIITETRTQLVEAKERGTRLRDDVQAQRQWQRCPRCYKTFATKT